MFRRLLCWLILPRRLTFAAAVGFIAVTPAANAEPRSFSVVRQPLDQALRQLATQGQVQILFASEDVCGRTSTEVAGLYEPEAAFMRALGRSGLTVRRIDGRTVSRLRIRPRLRRLRRLRLLPSVLRYLK
jgi:hypothetical protein